MDSWENLKRDCAACRGCSLCETRHNLVFGTGNEQTQVMLIGEGPGEQEDKQGIPFVGPAGHLLDDMLQMIDLDRSKVYIANIVKCRPPGTATRSASTGRLLAVVGAPDSARSAEDNRLPWAHRRNENHKRGLPHHP